MTDPNDRDIEAPVEDAAEQSVHADPNEQDEDTVSESLEAPEWDAQEQSRAVPLEDDYR